MKVLEAKEANLGTCLRAAQRDRVVITRKGKPVALIVGVEGMDLEQLELGNSKKLWDLIQKCRQQPSMSRAELEKRLAFLTGQNVRYRPATS
jgi:prevent-host-death family protein